MPNPFDVDPVLVEVVRDGLVESVHHGRVAVTGPDGVLLASLGDPDALVYPRSSSKPLQAVGMVRAGLDLDGELLAGASGWTWGEAAGIAMTWVHDEHRGTGLGAALLDAFEDEARRRGCTHVFVTSFTFQAPDFYRRRGYREIFRWEGVPTPDAADVHLRKEL